MELVMLITAGVFIVAGFVFFGIHVCKSDLGVLHWSRFPAIILLALGFVALSLTNVFDFPDDAICPSCNKEIHTTYCMECGAEGVLRGELNQHCPDCSGRIGKNEKFCGDCGAAVK